MSNVGKFLADYLFHKPRQKLQFKIIFLTILIVTIWMSISAYISLVTQTKYFLEGARRRVVILTQTIENSIIHSMLIGKHEDVRDLLINIADEIDMQKIRIINNQKLIMASADVTEIGKTLSEVDLSFIQEGKKELIITDEDYTKISMLKPIVGKSSCYNCHNRHSDIMGILDVRISISWMRVPLMGNRFFIILSSIVTIFLIGLSVYFLLLKLVAGPTQSLMKVMNIVRRGNWDARVQLHTTDELGKLGHTFNYMISEISELHEKDLRQGQALVRAEEELKYKRQIEEKNIQLERTIDILTTLSSIAKEIGSVLDLDQLILSILKMTTNILDEATGFFSIVDIKKKSLKYNYAFPENIDRDKESINKQLAQYVFCNEKALLIPDFAKEKWLHDKITEIKEYIPQSILCVPLYAKDKIIGIIGMVDKSSGKPFTADDLELVTTIANEAAVAVENFNLYSELKKSYFDTIRGIGEYYRGQRSLYFRSLRASNRIEFINSSGTGAF